MQAASFASRSAATAAVFGRAWETFGRPWLRLAPTAAIELANRTDVFARFHAASATARDTRLPTQVRRARELGPYAALWTVEGIGHGLTRASGANECRPGDSFAELPARAVPGGAWLPLHTGMGLALAERALARHGDLAAALDGFADGCERGSRRGYAGAAFEGLGFVARTLHRRSLATIDADLRERSRPGVLAFWHGVGRGLYFAPAHAFPGGTPAALREATAASSRAARGNAVAGLAWAATLVNVRERQVLAKWLTVAGGELGPADREAFAQGMGAALAVWSAWLGGRGGLPEASAWALEVVAVRRAFEDAAACCRRGDVEELFRLPV